MRTVRCGLADLLPYPALPCLVLRWTAVGMLRPASPASPAVLWLSLAGGAPGRVPDGTGEHGWASPAIVDRTLIA